MGEMVEETTNEQRKEEVLQVSEAAFFRIDSTEQVPNNRYASRATGIGGLNTLKAGSDGLPAGPLAY